MAHVHADRVADTTTTTGTGVITVSGTAPTGYRTFSTVMSVNDKCYYTIASQTITEWEVGIGTYSASNQLTRTTVISSSNAGSAVNFGAGTKDVFLTYPADADNSTFRGLFEHSSTIDVNYTIRSGRNAVSAGPVTVSSGITVTVPSGSRWVVL